MKKFFYWVIIPFLLIGSLSFQSCIGSFSLTSKVYHWNKGVGNKFVQEVVFLAANIIPVYSITLFADGVILNSIEFWTGSNPVAMNAKDVVKKDFAENGVKYEMTATRNKMVVTMLSGENKGKSFSLNYNPNNEMWSLNTAGKNYNLMQINPATGLVTVFNADGTTSTYAQKDFSVAQLAKDNMLRSAVAFN
jgi:hypothetical protein